jgi:hypothetical protein
MFHATFHIPTIYGFFPLAVLLLCAWNTRRAGR